MEPILCKSRNLFFQHAFVYNRNLCNKVPGKDIGSCYRILGIPVDSKQDKIREAFITLAKKYHPDSGSPEANIDKFVSIENAFRTLTNHNTGTSSNTEVEKIIFVIKHTAPQHRQYLSYKGVGFGTPFQWEKQWQQARAQQAGENVMEDRLSKAFASEGVVYVNFRGAIRKKGDSYKKVHDIKTKPVINRLVEDLIQESMSKGEFDNLSGKVKPLRDQNRNAFVDFTTNKINEVLLNNGFTPEWITYNNEIEKDIELLKEKLKKDRARLGPYPLTHEEERQWKIIQEHNRELAKSINIKINKFNLIVPLISKQKFYVPFDEICEEILKTGVHFIIVKKFEHSEVNKDFTGMVFKVFGEFFSFLKKGKSMS